MGQVRMSARGISYCCVIVLPSCLLERIGAAATWFSHGELEDTTTRGVVTWVLNKAERTAQCSSVSGIGNRAVAVRSPTLFLLFR